MRFQKVILAIDSPELRSKLRKDLRGCKLPVVAIPCSFELLAAEACDALVFVDTSDDVDKLFGLVERVHETLGLEGFAILPILSKAVADQNPKLFVWVISGQAAIGPILLRGP